MWWLSRLHDNYLQITLYMVHTYAHSKIYPAILHQNNLAGVLLTVALWTNNNFGKHYELYDKQRIPSFHIWHLTLCDDTQYDMDNECNHLFLAYFLSSLCYLCLGKTVSSI